ncbi:unnamed protein product, partial [Aureobasidium uvarum]
MLDEIHDRPEDFEQPSSDKNSYCFGRIGRHNIVIASLAAGVYGTTSAATTAVCMLSSFPSIKIGLMVGIGAAIARPKQKHDIRLGDVVVSMPHGTTGGVIQYDLGKSRARADQGNTIHTFERVGSLDSPPQILLKAITSLRARVRIDGSKVSKFLEGMLERYPNLAESEPDEPGFVYQGEENDRLFEASYLHTSDTGCDDCDPARIITRTARRNPTTPRFHYGVIASGNRLVKDAVERDKILKESGEDCICLEMEAAGLMNSFPCLVIKGICDYADSHKNDDWQEYAAATAAAYTKELLEFVDDGELAKTSRASEILRQISRDIKDAGDRVERLRLGHHQERIMDWLLAPDPFVNYTNALGKRHKGTGLWFVNGQAFNHWKKQPRSFLWLYGIPGCGKTVLSSTILEHLEGDSTTAQALLYFYFDFNDTEKQTLDRMLRCLVKQLYQQRPETQECLDRLWSSQQLSKQSLSGVLDEMLRRVDNVSIILDALDESRTRSEILVWLKSVLGNLTSDCRLLVTARREEEIESALRSWTRPTDRISIQGSDVDGDIRAYISHAVHNSKELNRWLSRSDVQDEIKSELMKKADGMFRWVACQIDALKNCLDYPRLRQTLKNLPKTLDETYARILESIPREHSEQAATVLNILTRSNRSLRMYELVDVVAINLDEDPEFDPKNRMPIAREVLRLCSSFVAVSWNKDPFGYRSDTYEEVRLAHFSVKEYLVSNHIPRGFEPLFSEAVARSYLARLCLTYLISVSRILSRGEQLPLVEDPEPGFPLLCYSADSWMIHAGKAGDETGVLWKLVSRFFLGTHEAFLLARDCEARPSKVIGESPLCYASHGGLLQAVGNLLDMGVRVNAEDNICALHAASAGGHVRIVQLLLNRGSRIDAHHSHWGTALQAAASMGRNNIIRLLLNRGAAINADGGIWGRALHAASAAGYDKTVQLLLDAGADIDTQDPRLGSALKAASAEGHDKVVRTLLDKGAHLGSRHEISKSPDKLDALDVACQGGHEQ